MILILSCTHDPAIRSSHMKFHGAISFSTVILKPLLAISLFF
uniref:Uncharacterized protein n=1 Tax=Arundo donax TaxID=35708 RepID=A0A0A9ADD0_ARUDO